MASQNYDAVSAKKIVR